jgi:hypothetical protein
MKAEEKAEELCRKMLFQIEWNAQPSTVKGVAKQCALIAVDEVLNSLEENMWQNRLMINYYEEVKNEIQKL